MKEESMKCYQCGKIIEDGIILDEDGDIVCSEECKVQFEKERELFFNTIVHDDVLFEKWMRGL